MTEVKAQLRHVRISSRKMRLVASAIRGLSVLEAERRLIMLSQRSAPLILKTLRSAVANAKHNADLKVEDLFIKTIIVNQGVALKRIRPAAMGAAHGYKKHAAHLEIIIATKPAVVVNQGNASKAVKAEIVTAKTVSAKPVIAKKALAVKKSHSLGDATKKTE